ncbi:hypothetical protein Tco_0805348, partial [Tanacetum coccineum]
EVISQEDMNLKLLRSLPSEWKTHALIWRNIEDIETISLDDLYNLKIYEPEITGSSSTSQNLQNVAFLSSNSNSSTNEADNTAYGVSTAHTQSNPTSGDNFSDAVICAFLASQPNSPQITNSNNNTNEADNTAYGVRAAHTQSNPTSGDNFSDAVICAFLASQPKFSSNVMRRSRTN